MRDTIKRHQDFITADTDPSARSAYFVVRAKDAKFPGDARVGFVATKRSFRFAVDRNRAKRLMRDWVRFNEALMLPEYDYIFIANAHILTATRDMGRSAMAKALGHIARDRVQNDSQNS
ncbi:MAG: ribonuclease P protein component [Alphaproteobacteria bacterium]|nr:ribonuclease P protein component [Alphaproteobacteria bacterium]MBR4806840.1 ribonuclease P protein component [Alphaproteobacteria bacterium]